MQLLNIRCKLAQYYYTNKMLFPTVKFVYLSPKQQITTTTTTTVLWPFVRDYRVSRYQKKHSPTHHPDHHPIFINFFHLSQSIASSLLKLRAWQSFCTTSFHVLFGLPLGLEPSTSYSIISSPNQCLLFAAHAHIIATCFAVVSILYNLFLVLLSTPYLELCLLP